MLLRTPTTERESIAWNTLAYSYSYWKNLPSFLGQTIKISILRCWTEGMRTRRVRIQSQLAAGVIEHSNAEWAAPVLFAAKKDDRIRLCVDYRKINTVTIKDSYPLPGTDECIDSVREARIFSTLDAFHGYWQINISGQDRQKTSFVCHSRTLQYIRMPCGLTNAPTTFQRALDLMLTRFKWKICLVYME